MNDIEVYVIYGKYEMPLFHGGTEVHVTFSLLKMCAHFVFSIVHETGNLWQMRLEHMLVFLCILCMFSRFSVSKSEHIQAASEVVDLSGCLSL
jgi:hypothetical protein